MRYETQKVALLYFSDINALVTNVGNKEGFGKNSVPVAVIDAKAKLMGKGGHGIDAHPLTDGVKIDVARMNERFAQVD